MARERERWFEATKSGKDKASVQIRKIERNQPSEKDASDKLDSDTIHEKAKTEVHKFHRYPSQK